MTQHDNHVSRRDALQALAVGAAAIAAHKTTGAFAAAPAAKTNPGAHWERWAKPQDAGFTNDLSQVIDMLYPLPTTSFMIVRGGKVALSYSDTSQVSYLASSRKSILSMLYGKYVANGTIKLDATLADLGIDDDQGLTPLEKTATVRHLLMSSSGVYHPAGSPGGSTETPPRGSKKPGTFFLYNNWDFNVVGAIFEKLTGKSVHKAFADDFAGPLQLEDFDPARQRMMGYTPSTSRYLAYHFFLSGRDMARLGLLMINGGRWNGKELVPPAWIKESTAIHMANTAIGGEQWAGYGYLWWVPPKALKDPMWANSYVAHGNFGQNIICMPAVDTVIVHRRAVTDDYAIARNTGRTSVPPAGGDIFIQKIMDKVAESIKV